MASKVEKCDNCSDENNMSVSDSKNTFVSEKKVNEDVTEMYEISDIYTNNKLSLSEINGIKIEDEIITCPIKQETNDCLDYELVSEDTNYVNDIQIKIKGEEIALCEKSTACNIENEIGFEIANTNDDIKIDQTVTDNIHFKFDKFISCDHCINVYDDYCTKCRMLLHILNGNTLNNIHYGAVKEIPNDILEIRESLENRAVYTLKHLPDGVKFGPFTGLKNSDHSWRIKGGRFIVSDDKLESLNWMQFINPAQSVLEHNLIAFLYQDNIYYCSIKEIQAGEELLVYFGWKYDISLKNDIEMDFIPTVKTDFKDAFACTFCCLGFNSLVHLAKHKTICPKETAENYSNREIVQCPHCNVYLEQWEYVEHHKKYCHDQDGRLNTSTSQDKIISLTSTNKQDELDKGNHMNGHHNVKEHTCEICYKKITRKECLKLHLTNMHIDEKRTKIMRCLLCQYETSNKSHLKAHVRSSHFKEGKYKCTKCTFQTKLESNLEQHFGIHETMKQVEYSKCDYERNVNLNSHEMVKRFQCLKCDYSTNLKCNLQKHFYIHETVKRFKCSQCDYLTNRKDNLKKHFDSHEKSTKEFKCAQCDYATNRKNNLKTHSYTHEILKRFKCSKCDFATSLKKNLKKHFGIHETIKRFKCSICDYATNCKDYLKNHLYTHDHVKRFKCAKCDYATNQKHHLKRHFATIKHST